MEVKPFGSELGNHLGKSRGNSPGNSLAKSLAKSLGNSLSNSLEEFLARRDRFVMYTGSTGIQSARRGATMPTHLMDTVLDKLSKIHAAIEKDNRPDAEFEIHELRAIALLLVHHPWFTIGAVNGQPDRDALVEGMCAFLRGLAQMKRPLDADDVHSVLQQD